MVEAEVMEMMDSLVHNYEALMDEMGTGAIDKEMLDLFAEEKERLLRMRRHMEDGEEE